MNSVQNLLAIASEPLSNDNYFSPTNIEGQLGHQLAQMLSQRNGFFAFESAMFIYPTKSVGPILGLKDFNSGLAWRQNYNDVIKPNLVCFGCDVFANQFGISDDQIVKFNPETGSMSPHSSSFNEWATIVLDHYNYETGWELAHEWQEKHGSLRQGDRLLGKKPFGLLGGDYTAENLFSVRLSSAMVMLGRLFEQIKCIPDGHVAEILEWGPREND